jgi:class 3 adenylate cyclase
MVIKFFRWSHGSKRLFGVFIIAAVLVCCGPLKDAHAIQPLVISPNQGRFELGPHLEILEDKNREWTIDDVSSPKFAHRFQPINSKVINLGITAAAIWMRFSIDSGKQGKEPDPAHRKWYLDFDRDFLEQCDLFIPIVSDEQASVKKRWRVIGSAGREGMNTSQPVALPLVFHLPGSLPSPQTLYLRVRHSAGLFLPLTLYSNEAYLSQWKKKMFWYGIYYGAILAMFLFNLFFFASLGERIYLYYLFYVGSIAIYFLFFNGILLKFFLPDGYYLHQVLNFVWLGFTIFWAVYFAKAFLVTKKHSRIFDHSFKLLLILAAVLIVSSPFADLSFLNQFSSILGIISPILIILAAVVCRYKGFQPVVFFMTAWSILSLGGLVFALTYRGILPYSAATINSFQIGSGLEVVILSFAVAHRMRTLRREHEKIKDTFGKYVTNEVRDEILYSRIPLDGEIKQVTLVFSDLRNFTPLVEATPPKEVVKIINGYFSEMIKAIQNHRGLILQFVGDEIETVFGAPLPLEDHPRHAVKAALEMRQRLISVNEKLESRNFARLRHGIGIHTGQVLAANIGGLDRLSYALVGDSVNVASRIQELNKKFGTDILISETTRATIGKEFDLVEIETTTLRGRSEHIKIFSVSDFNTDTKELTNGPVQR